MAEESQSKAKRSGNTPTITVVVPSLNHGDFLEQALHSILCQRGDFSLDCIVVDGGSTDRTLEILRRHETMYRPNNDQGVGFRWLSEKDEGPVQALAKGFTMAKGDILCWLNADDYYLHDQVLAAVSQVFASDGSLDLLFADGLYVNREGKILGRHCLIEINLRTMLLLDYAIFQPATFFRQRLLKPGDLRQELQCAFDADFFLGKLASRAQYAKLDQTLAAFRFYPENRTNFRRRQRNREQASIARRHVRNPFLLALSAFYHWAERHLATDLFQFKGARRALFRLLRRLCYVLISGKRARNHIAPAEELLTVDCKKY